MGPVLRRPWKAFGAAGTQEVEIRQHIPLSPPSCLSAITLLLFSQLAKGQKTIMEKPTLSIQVGSKIKAEILPVFHALTLFVT